MLFFCYYLPRGSSGRNDYAKIFIICQSTENKTLLIKKFHPLGYMIDLHTYLLTYSTLPRSFLRDQKLGKGGLG